jgi:putative MATE family efflux protein
MRTELLQETPFKLMLKLSIPAIIGMLVIGLYSFMDAVYAGQLIGPEAMGAISVAYPFTLFNSGIATLIGIGSASLLSRAIGKKDSETINKIMGNLLVLILILSSIVTLLGFVFTRELLLISGAEGEILELGVRYLRIVFLSSIFVNFAQSANMIIRAEGLMKKAMTFMGIGAVLNIVLDPIFILSFGEYAIEGAAVATVTSQIIQAAITLFYFIKESQNVRFNGIKIHTDLLPQIFSVGLSAMLMQVMAFIQQTVLYNMAAQYGGNSQIILMGASLRIMMFSFIPLWGISQAFQPAVGTNYGAGLNERVKKITNTFTIGATALALCFWIPFQLVPSVMLSMFIKDAAIVAEGVDFFRLMFSLFPVAGVFIIGLTFFQALGKGSLASIIVLLRQIILFVPLTVLLPKFMDIKGVWLSTPLTDSIVFLLCIIMLAVSYKQMAQDRVLIDYRKDELTADIK